MKSKLKKIINCLLGAIITTLLILLGSFLFMMFSSSKDGMRKTFFDTLFFQSITKSNGNVGMHFGFTENYMPIILTVVISFSFYYMVSLFYTKSNIYKNK